MHESYLINYVFHLPKQAHSNGIKCKKAINKLRCYYLRIFMQKYVFITDQVFNIQFCNLMAEKSAVRITNTEQKYIKMLY